MRSIYLFILPKYQCTYYIVMCIIYALYNMHQVSTDILHNILLM